MPAPDRREFYLEILSTMSVAYVQDQADFVAPQVFPVLEVNRQSASYNVWNKEDFMRDDMQPRPNGGETAGSGFHVSQTQYNCMVWGLHKDLTSQDEANWTATEVTPEEATALYLTQQGLRRRERQWVSKYFKTGVWKAAGSDGAPGTGKWDVDTSNPIADVQAGRLAILEGTGQNCNTMVVDYVTHLALQKHPDLLARVSGGATTGNPALVSAELIAQLFEVERYLVLKAVYASNVTGETTVIGFVAGHGCLLCHTSSTPSPMTPSAGYTFAWVGGDQMGVSVAISGIPMPWLKATRYEVEMSWDDAVTGDDLGYYIDATVS